MSKNLQQASDEKSELQDKMKVSNRVTMKMLLMLCYCICSVFAVYCSGDNNNNNAAAEYKEKNFIQHSERIHSNVNDMLTKRIQGRVYDSELGERRAVNILQANQQEESGEKTQGGIYEYVATEEVSAVVRRFFSVDPGMFVSMNFGDARYGISGGIECGAFWLIPFGGDSYDISNSTPSLGAQCAIYATHGTMKDVVIHKLLQQASDEKAAGQVKTSRYPIVLFKPIAMYYAGVTIGFGISGRFKIFISGGYCLRQYRFYNNYNYEYKTLDQNGPGPSKVNLSFDINTKTKWRHGCYLRCGGGMKIDAMLVKVWFGINFMNSLFDNKGEFVNCSDLCGGVSVVFDFQTGRRFYFSLAPSVTCKMYRLASKINVTVESSQFRQKRVKKTS